MFKNLSTKTKLLYFPILIILIAVIIAFTYSSSINYIEGKTQIAAKTQDSVKTLLEARITVYQFMQDSTQEKSNIVVNEFKKLKDQISALKNLFESEKNRKISDDSIAMIDEYIKNFENMSNLKMSSSPASQSSIENSVSIIAQIAQRLQDTIISLNEDVNTRKDAALSSLNIQLVIIGLI